MIPNGFLDICTTIGMALVLLSVLFAFARIARGPSFSDRVVALDMMSVSIVAFCGLFAIRTGISAFLDVGIVMALIGFLATVALARFAERGLHRRQEQPKGPDEMIDPLATGPDEAQATEEAKP